MIKPSQCGEFLCSPKSAAVSSAAHVIQDGPGPALSTETANPEGNGKVPHAQHPLSGKRE